MPGTSPRALLDQQHMAFLDQGEALEPMRLPSGFPLLNETKIEPVGKLELELAPKPGELLALTGEVQEPSPAMLEAAGRAGRVLGFGLPAWAIRAILIAALTTQAATSPPRR